MKDQYIDVVWEGHISSTMATQCNAEILAATQDFIARKQSVLLRFTVRHPPLIPNSDAFSEGLKILDAGIPFARIVIWGRLPHLVRILANALIDSYTSNLNVKYIQNEQLALAWLIKGDESHG